MNHFKKLSAFILSILLIVTASVQVYAAGPLESTALDITKSASTTDATQPIDITFNLPTQVITTKTEVDLVFVMDTSTIDNPTLLKTKVNAFLDTLKGSTHLKVNVGVVTFSQYATDRLKGLLELNDANETKIKNAFSGAGAGSNLVGGLLKAQALLEAGTASNENKYMVLVSDLAGYKSDAGDGTGLTFYFADKYGTNGYTKISGNQDFHGRYYAQKTAEEAQAFFTVDKIDQLIKNKVLLSGTSVTADTEKYLVEMGMSASEYAEYKFSWSDLEKSYAIPNYAFTAQAAFPTMFEKSIYQSGNILLNMKAKNYKIYGLTVPYQPEDGQEYKRKFNAANNAFQVWFEENIGPRYQANNGQTIEDITQDIENELVYLLGKGKITDVIKSDFTYIPGYESVKLNGVELAKTVIDDHTIGFGAYDSVQAAYPYVFSYTKDDATGKETVVWTLNTTARKDDLLQLNFREVLKEIPAIAGDYTYDTNASATIDYMDSKEVSQGVTDYTKTSSMPSPQAGLSVGQIQANYIDEAGNTLHASYNDHGLAGETYTTEQLAIAGYTFKEIKSGSADASGQYDNTAKVVTYVYTLIPVKKSGTVIAAYVDEAGNEISPAITTTGEAGTAYSTEQLVIDGYSFKEIKTGSAAATGSYTEATQTVTYVYTKNATIPVKTIGTVIAAYVDEAGNEISPAITTTGDVGTAYSTAQLSIEGYTFKEIKTGSAAATGSYTEATQTVTYVYTKDVVHVLPNTGVQSILPLVSGLILSGLVLLGVVTMIKRRSHHER